MRELMKPIVHSKRRLFMYLSNNNYQIHISDTKQNSFAYISQAMVLDPFGYMASDLKKELYLEICFPGGKQDIILVVDYMVHTNHIAILSGDSLFILLSFNLIELDLKTFRIVRTLPIESMSNNFSLFKCIKGYLVYGETDVTMFDWDWSKRWQFSARDIFVHPEGYDAFLYCDDRIFLLDWEGYYYELDMDGNLLKDQKISEMRQNGCARFCRMVGRQIDQGTCYELIKSNNGEKISEMIKGPLQKARQLCAKCPFNSCTSRI